MNIIKMDKDIITPTDIYLEIQSELETYTDMYVVAFDSKGNRTLWATSNLARMALAVVVLQDRVAEAVSDGQT